MITYNADVLIIGAGPSGSVAAALLRQAGHSVCIFERGTFPRFSIGESLLPQSMHFLEKAGVLAKVKAAGFQYKDGAAFQNGDRDNVINFKYKTSAGYYDALEVQRARFDALLAEHAVELGADLHFEHTVTAYYELEDTVELKGETANKQEYTATGKFVLDASGYGRVLPQLLDLEKPSNFPARKAVFCHIKDGITDSSFDRNKILITVRHNDPNIWFWLIPFSDGTSSIGAVGPVDSIMSFGTTDAERLTTLIQQDPYYARILPSVEFTRPVGSMQGYSCSVKQLYGKRFALLGNAGEFLDPVFSSGITIALKSADLAVELICRQLNNQEVNWEQDFAQELMIGVNTFRNFVEAWYDSSLQEIIFFEAQDESKVKQLITSILAGYAWDKSNPFVRHGKQLLEQLSMELV